MTTRKIIASAILFLIAPFYEACVIKVMANGNELGDITTSIEKTYVDNSHTEIQQQNTTATTPLPQQESAVSAKPKIKKRTPKKRVKRPRPKTRRPNKYKRVVSKRPPSKRNKAPKRKTITRRINKKLKKVKKCPTRSKRNKVYCKYKPRR